MRTIFSVLLFAALAVSSPGQNNDQATSPNGAYKLQKTTSGTWAIFDNNGKPLNSVTPRRATYDKIVTIWGPDSEKVAVLAMTLKTSDIYVIGTKHTYAVTGPSVSALKEIAIPRANFKYNPQSYFFHDNGAVSVKWLNAQQLQISTEFRADLSDTQLGQQDHWEFIIGYGFDLADEIPSKNLQVLKVREQY
jgi:hypothetical protein